MPDFVPIRITGIIVELVSRPRNDGGLGSGLYDVPLQLSAKPATEWARLFVQTWNQFSAAASSYRRVICEVVGDRVWLRGTTIEQIEETCMETLKLALADANQGFADYIVKTNAEGERLRKEQETYEQHIREAAKNIRFD